jgi:hypothetical protein
MKKDVFDGYSATEAPTLEEIAKAKDKTKKSKSKSKVVKAKKAK